MGRWIIILIVVLVFAKSIKAQMHYSYASNTGNNATIGIPISINPVLDGHPIALNDEIAVFADGRVMPDSFCVGVAVWTGKNISITVWGDNDQTASLDGIKGGTKFHFHIWRTAENKEYTNTVVAYSQGDSLYRANGVYVLASLYAGVHQGTSRIIVEPAIGNVPDQIFLQQNYPNPFNSSTVISYQLPSVGAQYIVSLRVLDLLGREVALLVNEVNEPGRYFIRWDAAKFSSGTYFYRLVAQSFGYSNLNICDTKKLVLIR